MLNNFKESIQLELLFYLVFTLPTTFYIKAHFVIAK